MFEDLIKHFGKENQIKKTIEELKELIEALESGNEKFIFEELCDVLIMLRQLKVIYEIDSSSIMKQVKFKYERTLIRIASGYYEDELKMMKKKA